MNIMSHLPLADRRRHAQTCRALEASFCHPSLWNTVTIILGGDIRFLAHAYPSQHVMGTHRPANSLSLVERFGAYFKDLTLVYIDSGRGSMPRDCVEVIQCIKRCCRYERLTLNGSFQARAFCPNVLHTMAQLFINKHLKSFALLGVTCSDIRVLLSHDKLNGCLERLGLQHYDGEPKLGLPIITSQFTQLRALYLDSRVVSDDLIESLSDQGRAPLRELGIQVTQDLGLPQTKPRSWIRLRTHSPSLQVHVKVMNGLIHQDELFDFLLLQIPVASIHFCFTRSPGFTDMILLADWFCSTLRKFIDLRGVPTPWRCFFLILVLLISIFQHTTSLD